MLRRGRLQVEAMRPKQWTKNGFVFAGLVFSRSFLVPGRVGRVFLAFAAFCMISGCVYMMNDVIDREKDVLHPVKKKRPIASGRLAPTEALTFSAVLAAVTFTFSFFLDKGFFILLLGYFLLVTSYSLVLKHIPFVDVAAIAAGFVLRTVGGAVVIHVWISPWLILCTTLLALFLALHKRRNELAALSDSASGHRKSLGFYTRGLIDQILVAVILAITLSYCLYILLSGRSYYMIFTVPFVLFGIFRYQYLAVRGAGGSPEAVLLQDRALRLDILLWVTACIAIAVLT